MNKRKDKIMSSEPKLTLYTPDFDFIFNIYELFCHEHPNIDIHHEFLPLLASIAKTYSQYDIVFRGCEEYLSFGNHVSENHYDNIIKCKDILIHKMFDVANTFPEYISLVYRTEGELKQKAYEMASLLADSINDKRYLLFLTPPVLVRKETRDDGSTFNYFDTDTEKVNQQREAMLVSATNWDQFMKAYFSASWCNFNDNRDKIDLINNKYTPQLIDQTNTLERWCDVYSYAADNHITFLLERALTEIDKFSLDFDLWLSIINKSVYFPHKLQKILIDKLSQLNLSCNKYRQVLDRYNLGISQLERERRINCYYDTVPELAYDAWKYFCYKSQTNRSPLLQFITKQIENLRLS